MRVGYEIGDWLLERSITYQGNQSQTFRAVRHSDNEIGFFKSSRYFVNEIAREARTYEMLDKRLCQYERYRFPHLLTPLSSVKIENETYYFLVTEWIDGEPLETFLRSSMCVPTSLLTLVYYMNVVLDLMNILHQNGIVHDDLHLGNVMVHEDNNRISLVDFGWASTEFVNSQKKSIDVFKTMWQFEDFMRPDQLKVWRSVFGEYSTTKMRGIKEARHALDLFVRNAPK